MWILLILNWIRLFQSRAKFGASSADKYESLGRSSTRHFWAEGGNRKWAVSYLTCLHITTLILVSVFSLIETWLLWKYGGHRCLCAKCLLPVYFRGQKRWCLSSLFCFCYTIVMSVAISVFLNGKTGPLLINLVLITFWQHTNLVVRYLMLEIKNNQAFAITDDRLTEVFQLIQ